MRDANGMIGTSLTAINDYFESNGYVAHNSSQPGPYSTLEEAINGYNQGNGEPIAVIGIR